MASGRLTSLHPYAELEWGYFAVSVFSWAISWLLLQFYSARLDRQCAEQTEAVSKEEVEDCGLQRRKTSMNVPNGCDGRISTKLHPKKQERKIASSCSDEADSILAGRIVKGAI